MIRKVMRIQGDTQDFIVMLGQQSRHQGRLIIGSPSSSGRRIRPYQTAINGFGGAGVGHPFVLNPGRQAWQCIERVESIMFGHMEMNGMIVWHPETERRA